MEDSSEDQSNSMSVSSISAGSSYYYCSDVDDAYEYDEDSKIEKEIIQDQKTTSEQRIDKKYESDISSAKQLRTNKKKKIQETKTESEKGHKCRKCARSYKHVETLRNHKRFECGVTPQFICIFCDKRFKRKGHMDQHMVCVHQVTFSNQKRQKIDESEQKHIGNRHQKSNINTSQAKLICDICSKVYSSLSGLYDHTRFKHAAAKPQFICDYCGHKTYRKSDLSKHISVSHFKNSKTSGGRHNCDECSLNYYSLASLREHKRLKHATVKPEFICDLCGYKPYKKYHLRRHISSRHLKNTKTSDVRYNCEKCSLTYRYSRSLIRHKRLKHATVNT